MRQPSRDRHLLAKYRPVDVVSPADKAVAAASEAEEVVANPRALPGDQRRIRGWPAVGSGCAGAIAGSVPHRDAIKKLGG